MMTKVNPFFRNLKQITQSQNKSSDLQKMGQKQMKWFTENGAY